MRLDNYDEFIKYVVDKFTEEDEIQAICNYELADLLMYEFGIMDYKEYKGIDLQSDVNEYYVTKFGEKCFCVEPLKSNNKIKITSSNYFIIDNKILKDNPTLFNYLETGRDEVEFQVEIIDYDEDNCDCCECCEECEDNEMEETVDCYLELADLIEDYVGLILDNECKEEVLGHALTEFAGMVLEEFCLERTEE
ncbi:hypothetical protein [Clostridium rectalis]|uniref:hypothetical protein n=1 Tax=Clostridium rectalis TaxID=2040295 RepID=UPI000F63574D|nr:hypothetical protein [Clostridium rectalis]